MKQRYFVVSISLEPDVDTITRDATDCLMRDLKSSYIICCFLFILSEHSSFSRTVPPIVFCVFMNAPSLSSSYLLITIYGSMPGFSWPKTGCNNICAAALKVLHPLKLLSQNIQIAFLAQPFIGSAWFDSTATAPRRRCRAERRTGPSPLPCPPPPPPYPPLPSPHANAHRRGNELSDAGAGRTMKSSLKRVSHPSSSLKRVSRIAEAMSSATPAPAPSPPASDPSRPCRTSPSSTPHGPRGGRSEGNAAVRTGRAEGALAGGVGGGLRERTKCA